MVLSIKKNMEKWYPYLVINHKVNAFAVILKIAGLTILDAPGAVVGALYKSNMTLAS